jgi:hypothetical protein
MMVHTKQGVQNKADVPMPPSTPTLQEPPSRESCSATTQSAPAPSRRIEARAARIAALDSAFTVDPTIEAILHSDNGEWKFDDTRDEGNKDKDREDDGNYGIGGDEGSDVDEDEDYVAAEGIYDDEDEDDNFYKSSLFDDNDDNSIDDAKVLCSIGKGGWCWPQAKEWSSG